jgi:hypothetical protein
MRAESIKRNQYKNQRQTKQVFSKKIHNA